MNIQGRNATRKDQAKLAKPMTKKALKSAFERTLEVKATKVAGQSVRRPIAPLKSKAEQWKDYLQSCVIAGNVTETKVNSWKPEYI